MTAVAIIPARGGSKRIPHKNIKEFCGRPIIAWPIQTARESGCFDRIIVSTDDDEVAAVAREWGAETPFVRPRDLSDDRTGTRAVTNHALTWLRDSGEHPDFACCVYATAPLLRAADLRDGLEALQTTDASFAFSVATFASPVQRALRLLPEGGVEMLYPQYAQTRSQDLEEAYHDAGQFYWGRTDAFLADLPVFSPNSIPVVMLRHRVQDIDTAEDWHRAELMFRLIEDEA